MIRQNRGAIIFGISVLLIMFAAAYLKSQSEEGNGAPSSYSNLAHGAKAAYLLLQQSGYPVERWDRPPKELPADARGKLLILAAPTWYATAEETRALSLFLSHGGSILVAGLHPDSFVPKAAAKNGEIRIGSVECQAVAPTRLTRGGSISLNGNLQWDSTDSSQLVHFADPQGNAVVVSYSAGNGSVIWWASAWPLENAGIREKNNLELLLNSTAGYQSILWDEYFQKQHKLAPHKPIKAYAWAVAQLTIIGLALVLTYSRRSGPIVPLAVQTRSSPLEFVETLAGVFRRANSTHVAVEIALQRFRQVAAQRLGLRGTSSVSEIIDAMAHRGFRISDSSADLVRKSEYAVNNATLTERTAIAFVRALNEATQSMEPKRKSGPPPSQLTRNHPAEIRRD